LPRMHGANRYWSTSSSEGKNDGDHNAQRECQQIVMACLPEPLAQLAKRGCEAPYDLALLDEEGTTATGLIDENGDGELVFNRIPALPFTITIADRENMKGVRIVACRPWQHPRTSAWDQVASGCGCRTRQRSYYLRRG
jgi:hypothetical protein